MIHPESRALLDELAGWPLPGQPGFDLAADRAAPGPPRTAEHVELVADVTVGGVACRRYRPAGAPGVVVHLHGGGFVEGGLDSHDALCHRLAARSGWEVLAVDYRLAPEHPFPAALQDAAAVLTACGDGPVVLLGDSAGGTLVAALARHRLRPVALQVLVYPALGAAEPLPSRIEFAEGYGLTDAAMAWYLDAYVPDPADRDHPDVAPGLAEPPPDLPPALVITAELDPVRDDGERYAQRLAAAGVPARCTRYPGTVHGFWRRPATVAAARAAIDEVAAAIRGCAPAGG